MTERGLYTGAPKTPVELVLADPAPVAAPLEKVPSESSSRPVAGGEEARAATGDVGLVCETYSGVADKDPVEPIVMVTSCALFYNTIMQ
jgi:hypothetical protein